MFRNRNRHKGTKVSEPHPERTTSDLNGAEAKSDLPWSPEDIKEMLGFDRNDPNVSVRIIPGSPTPFILGKFGDQTLGDSDFGPAVTAPVTALEVAVGILTEEVADELYRAMEKHGPQNSPHEGISILREEFEGLWDHVKADTGRTPEARKEAIQIAAMALRYVIDNIGTRGVN